MIMNTLQAKTSIKPLELHRLLAEGAPAQLLDVRTPGEFAAAHVPGAKLIPLDDLDPAAFQRQRGAEEIPVYVLCQSGGRARKAIEKLERAGVHGCVLVEGGTQGWIDAGLPVERASKQGFAADAPGANHGRPHFSRWRGSCAGRQPALCHYPAGHGLRPPVCRTHRHVRIGAVAGENAVEPRPKLRFVL